MQTVTTIGLDIAKSVFQVHGVDAAGQVLIRRQLKRRTVLAFFEKLPPCLVGIEACASSHHWSRELQALGHTVRLMPPAYVKPYVNGTGTMRPMRGPSARQSPGRTCGRRDQDPSTELPDTPPHTPFAYPAADVGDQCHPGSSCGVWHRRTDWTQWCRATVAVVADANDRAVHGTSLPPCAVERFEDRGQVDRRGSGGNKIRSNSQGREDVRVIGELKVLMVVAYKGQLYLSPEARPAKFETVGK